MPELDLFDIQRGSFVDGPGIRTVVFFKGCSLFCKWCHNPESRPRQPVVGYFADKCVHCGACLAACPAGAIAPSLYTDPSKCVHCGRCRDICPNGARSLYGYREDADRVLGVILRDKMYYDNSGGGATFSGGECMLQTDALLYLLKKCRENGVKTAVDTAGHVKRDSFELVYPYADLFLYDIKCVDPALSRELIGQDGELILSNYRYLHSLGPEKLIVRVPVIPGMNDAGRGMEDIADLLAQYPPSLTELLPYHRLGEGKYAALGLPYDPVAVPSDEHMEDLRALFRSKGLTVGNG